jgi:hypothetical protein
MAPRVNDPEMFGIFPGDPGYETFDKDFPEGDEPITDYSKADWEDGKTPPYGTPIIFPETAEEEHSRVGRWFRDNYKGPNSNS